MVPQWLINTKSRLRLVEIARKFAVPQKPRYIVSIPEDDKEKSENVCEYLVSDSSPFKACRESNKLNFTNMYESCDYDVAVSTLDDAHCPTLQSTALACSRHGYPVHYFDIQCKLIVTN
jgi:hypothetical protein